MRENPDYTGEAGEEAIADEKYGNDGEAEEDNR